jgi:hypothetical protein
MSFASASTAATTTGHAAPPSRIRITAAGQRFTAWTHPDAPRTVAAFRTLLPYRQRLIHVRWSGEACWIPLGDFRLGVELENATSHPSAGDVLFHPGGISEAELLIAYGACRFSSRVGQLAGNHFMTIVDAGAALRELGRTVLWQGAQDVLFEADD